MDSVLRNLNKIVPALVLATGIHSTSASAESTVVVELFTSQGCSSCPPADRVLTELQSVKGVLPLSLNVDYWDYLGWEDDLALPGNAKRQRSYSRKQRARNIYTPQIMIEGKMDVIGNRRSQVMAAVNAYLAEPDRVAVSIVPFDASSIRVSLPANGGLREQAVIWLVGYDHAVTKDIGRGENAGESITYSNVVRDWQEAARWDGNQTLNLTMNRPKGDGGAVVIVQTGEVGAILGAAKLEY